MVHDTQQIFISYASPDKVRVTPFYDALKKRGFNVWMDCQCLLAGQNWDFEIKRSFAKSSFVVAFVSANSISRRGYVQRELKLALDKLTERLIDDIYLIPVLLDDNLALPDELKLIQAIHASDSESYEKIANSINHQLIRIGIETQKIQQQEDIYWSFKKRKESWDGLPGYEVELDLINFRSDKYDNISDIGEYINGGLIQSLFNHRAGKLIQYPELFDYGQNKYSRTNTYDAYCNEPKIKGKILTVQYAIHWYGAGAAHPNHFYNTFSFALDPLFRISALSEIFTDTDNALNMLQAEVRLLLYQVRLGDDTEEKISLETEWVDKGTENWSDFEAFVFGDNGIEILFAPYQVAAYACGPQFAEVGYIKLVELINPQYRCLLGIEHINYHAKISRQR